MMNNKENRRGFTLVETLVSIAIFGMISMALINIFMSGIKGQARILQNQELMEQSSYSLEYIGKIVRMAKKDEVGSCTGTANANYGGTTTSIFFLAYDSKDQITPFKCRNFYYDTVDNTIKEKKSTDATAANLSAAGAAITSSRVKVTSVRFNVTGDGADTIQPRTTIMIKMESNINSSSAPQIIVQSTISQRQLDVAN